MKTLIFVFSLMLSGLALAHPDDHGDYVRNSYGEVWKNSYGECWHSRFNHLNESLAECGDTVAKTEEKEFIPGLAIVTEPFFIEHSFKFGFDKSQKESIDATIDELLDDVKPIHDIEYIKVYAHTDSVGPEKYNLDLSARRLDAVADRLMAKVDNYVKNLDSDKLDFQAFGELSPIDTNSTAEGRANNRRVDLQIKGNRIKG